MVLQDSPIPSEEQSSSKEAKSGIKEVTIEQMS